MQRGPPTTVKAPARFPQLTGATHSQIVTSNHNIGDGMSTLHDFAKNSKRIEFIGIVGKAGPRHTAYGWAIDIADNSLRPCKWIDVVPNDPDAISGLCRGNSVRVDGVILEDGDRPLAYAKVTLLE